MPVVITLTSLDRCKHHVLGQRWFMIDKTFRAELTAPLLLVACSLWFLTGLYQYLNGGSWLFMTLPLFGIAGAWRRARRRRREEPVPDISRELSREDLWPGVLVAVALVLWLGMLVAPGI